MTTSLARTARPPSAAIAWVQDDRLFVELPTHTGVPYICTYKRTLEGPQTGGAKPHPAVRKLATFTDDQRAGVRAILKAKGIL